MDGTQTSDPIGVGPGSPGQASAFRRALDKQAVHGEAATEGPLDLTVPLDLAEIRAALSGSGSQPKVDAIPAPAAAPGATGGGTRRPRRGGHGHGAPRRLGRIGVFVALATALSAGTAAALVLSSGGQNQPVSLPPANGNIPIASRQASPAGALSVPSASASASPSASARRPSAPPSTHSAAPLPSTAAPSASATPSASQGSPSPSASATAASQSPSISPSGWVTLYWGIAGETAEVTEVQQMLAQSGYLKLRHSSYIDTSYSGWDPPPDAPGTYQTTTQQAVADFQAASGIDQSGEVDAATLVALEQASGLSASSSPGAGGNN